VWPCWRGTGTVCVAACGARLPMCSHLTSQLIYMPCSRLTCSLSLGCGYFCSRRVCGVLCLVVCVNMCVCVCVFGFAMLLVSEEM